MPKAIMDPEEVRRFATELRRFNSDLQSRVTSLQARFAALGDTWQDQEHDKFADEFKQTVQVLRKFLAVSNDYGPYLLRKAQRIEEYLEQH
ncbi:MAG: WXG100 family type VII secretion target [Spartobacteria bacterium]|nr:WXG100 family type VII secretion target [Spartobacteria bacterium]